MVENNPSREIQTVVKSDLSKEIQTVVKNKQSKQRNQSNGQEEFKWSNPKVTKNKA